MPYSYIKRKPDFDITIKRQNFDSTTSELETVVVFVPLKTGIDQYKTPLSNAIISYTFSENLNSASSNFNFVLTLERDSEGKTWLDKLQQMDLVFISEFKKVQYVGYIKDIRYSASVSDEGKVERSIVVTGGNLGDLLSSFKLLIDQSIYQANSTAMSISKRLSARLASEIKPGGKVSSIVSAIYESFFELVLKTGNVGGRGIKPILDDMIDIEKGIPSSFVVKFPVSLSLYQRGENNIWEMLQGLCTPPVNELFGLWDNNIDKFKIVFRQTPFEPEDWNELSLNVIPPDILTDFSLGKSVSDIFTFYLCTLPGSGIDRNKAMVIDEAGKKYVIDEEKWKKYGYRPLIVEFRYFDRSHVKSFNDSFKLMIEFSTMLKRWYENNDKMYSGTISFMTIDESYWKNLTGLRNPRIGERIQLLDGEFYVENSTHSWSYLGPMSTTLNITRGYVYDEEGNPIWEMEEVGRQRIDIDPENDRNVWG